MLDREEMVKVALSGLGTIGNDLACPFDPDYAKDIPQRAFDPDQARFLVKQAGKEGATVRSTPVISAPAWSNPPC